MTQKKLAIFFVLLTFGGPLFGYSTPNVPIDDPVYRDIDKLIAAGLVTDLIYSQRPWSRREIARILAVSMENRKKIPPEEEGDPLGPSIDRILEHRMREYREDFIVPLEQVQLDYTLLDSPSRPVPANNGLGGIDARTNPLVGYREGRHYVDGSTVGLETTHRGEFGRFFSLYGRPRLELLAPNTGVTEVRPVVQQAYGKFAYGNLELEAGRDSLIWGQGETGGLLFSNNARPLDMIKLSSSAPFYHPWFLKYLGPSKYTLFAANLGPEQQLANPFLYGIRATIKPVNFFEFSFQQAITIGGNGAPPLKWYDPISEFFFVRLEGFRGQGSNISDHRFGVDWRMRIPPLKNTEWYFETLWDDFGRETVSANVTEQMAFSTGIYLPRLISGAGDLRFEFNHIPPILYRHGVWISGYTLNRRLIGPELGPDSDSLKLTLRREIAIRYLLSTAITYENRDSDAYIQSTSSKGGPDRVIKTTENPTEHRWRIEGNLGWKIREDLRARLDLGYEHLFPGDNFLGAFSIIWDP